MATAAMLLMVTQLERARRSFSRCQNIRSLPRRPRMATNRISQGSSNSEPRRADRCRPRWEMALTDLSRIGRPCSKTCEAWVTRVSTSDATTASKRVALTLSRSENDQSHCRREVEEGDAVRRQNHDHGKDYSTRCRSSRLL